jgi:hypothetical protein
MILTSLRWIPLLLFTALNCRQHRIRHQAVELLAGSAHKEGMYSSLLSVIIAKKVIDIEEGAFYSYLQNDIIDRLALPTPEELSIMSLPEERRLKNLQITLPDDRNGKIRLQALLGPGSIATEYQLTSRSWSPILWISD